MALRLGELVVCGEIFNKHRYSVHGHLQLRAPGGDRTMVVELTGACSEDLAGWHFRFEPRQPPAEYDPEEQVDLSEDSPVAWHQIGPTGTFTAAHFVRVLGGPPREKHRCLYLEWYGQNGRTVIELMDPVIEFVEREPWAGGPETPGDEPPPDSADESEQAGLQITEVRIDDDGEAHVTDIDPADYGDDGYAEDDPYGLMPPELQSELDSEAWRLDQKVTAKEDKPKWLRETELMDDLIENDPGVSLLEVFDELLRVPKPNQLTEGPEAEAVLKTVLSQMALYGIQFHICEHFTPLEAYRLLVEEVGPESRVFPQMRNTQWVQCHSTHDHCPRCDEEFERKYRATKNLDLDAQTGRPAEEDNPF